MQLIKKNEATPIRHEKKDPKKINNFTQTNKFNNISTKGTIKSISPTSLPYLISTTEEIPLSNLRESNPILWSDMIPLFEDELGTKIILFYLTKVEFICKFVPKMIL